MNIEMFSNIKYRVRDGTAAVLMPRSRGQGFWSANSELLHAWCTIHKINNTFYIFVLPLN